MRSKIATLGFILLMISFNTLVYSKEQSIKSGRRVVLELAPVDPRSLMQGDYMILNYRLATMVKSDLDRGTVYLKLDSQDLATTLVDRPEADTVPLRYRRQNYKIKFDIESYLVQEGQRQRFEKAKYSELRVSADGQPTLVKLLDENFETIEP